MGIDQESQDTHLSTDTSVDIAVGRALHAFRTQQNLTLQTLSDTAGVSRGMISRIENGQVSPSLNTLTALAQALDTSLISLFQHTVGSTDITFVKKNEGLKAIRQTEGHKHEFTLLGYHKRHDISFEPIIVTINKKPNDMLPLYYSHGCLLIHLLEGEAVYQYGESQYHMHSGDSLSFDASVCHGFIEVISAKIKFISVGAQGKSI